MSSSRPPRPPAKTPPPPPNPPVTAAASAAQSKAAAAARTATVTPSAKGAATQAAFKAAEQLVQAKGRINLQEAQNNFKATQNKINSIKFEAARDQQRAKENQAIQQSGKTQKTSGKGDNSSRSNTTTTNRNTGKNIQIEFAPGGRDSRLRPGAGPKGTGDPAPEFDPPWNIVLPPRRKPGDLPKDEDKSDTPTSSLSVAESYSTPAPRPTLIPGRDVVELAAPQVSAESMEQLLFQQLSSFEIVNLARRDTIEGLNPYYSVISNLSSIREEYNPSQIISLQKPAQGLSDLYQIKLSDKIPNDAYLTRNNITNFFYIDNNGDFIIELDNMLVDEVIEIQIATSGKIT